MLELRLQLASARATLRAAKDDHELSRAQAEQRAIDGGVNGKNADERARNLTLALAQDDSYQHALHRWRAAEAELDRLDALLEGACDARRAEEWHIRARLADGLFRANVQSDSRDPSGESAFDDTLDQTTGEIIASTYPDHMSGGSPHSSHYAGKRRPQPNYSLLADEDLPF